MQHTNAESPTTLSIHTTRATMLSTTNYLQDKLTTQPNPSNIQTTRQQKQKPTGQASYRQQYPEQFRKPDADTSDDINAAMPSSPSPTPEPQATTRTQRRRPHTFKTNPFSQTEVKGGKRPARPPGPKPKPKPLHAVEITDLYPEDDPNISAAPLLRSAAPQDATTRKSSRRNAPPPTPSLSPSEHHLLRPQRFLSFLAEYTTSFVNYVFDINVSHQGRYGLGRSRMSRDTRYYGEGRREGQGTQTLRNRERERGRA
jgi:hypothetical protein